MPRSWFPTAPHFKVKSPLPIKGRERNQLCPCGSGVKKKRCVSCFHGIPHVHSLSDGEYFNGVEMAIRNLLPEHNVFAPNSAINFTLLRSYYATKAITVEEAAALLVQKHELDVEAERLHQEACHRREAEGRDWTIPNTLSNLRSYRQEREEKERFTSAAKRLRVLSLTAAIMAR